MRFSEQRSAPSLSLIDRRMMNENLFRMAVWAFFLLLAARIGVYFSVVSPYLKSKGLPARFPFMKADTYSYRSARLSAGEPLTWFYALRVMQILGLVLLWAVLYLQWREHRQSIHSSQPLPASRAAVAEFAR